MVKFSPKMSPQVVSQSILQSGNRVIASVDAQPDPMISRIHDGKIVNKPPPSAIKVLSNRGGKTKVRKKKKKRIIKMKSKELSFWESYNDIYPTLQISPGRWKCIYCSKIVGRKSSLIDHIKSHKGEKPHICGYCRKRFTNKSNLNRHMRIHIRKQEISSLPMPSIPGLDFELGPSMQQAVTNFNVHDTQGIIKVETKPKTRAPLVEQKHNIKVEIQDEQMPANAIKLYPLKEVEIETGFKTHELQRIVDDRIKLDALGNINLAILPTNTVAEKRYICIYCSKTLARKTTLLNHLKSHTGDMPYVCVHCSRGFTSRYNLSRHMLRHTGEKPYKCGYCGKAFARPFNRNRHQLTHSDYKPFSCINCKRAFFTKYKLTEHLKVHNEKQTFMCSLCSLIFSEQHQLDCHLPIHSGEVRIDSVMNK